MGKNTMVTDFSETAKQMTRKLNPKLAGGI